MEEEWTVAIVTGASSDSTNLPCCRVTLNSFPDICDMDLIAVDTSVDQRFIQEFSDWSDKRLSRAVFLVPGLFAYKHDCGFRTPFPEHRLSRGLPKIACLTRFRSLP